MYNLMYGVAFYSVVEDEKRTSNVKHWIVLLDFFHPEYLLAM
jgi:hypothetical protein